MLESLRHESEKLVFDSSFEAVVLFSALGLVLTMLLL